MDQDTAAVRDKYLRPAFSPCGGRDIDIVYWTLTTEKEDWSLVMIEIRCNRQEMESEPSASARLIINGPTYVSHKKGVAVSDAKDISYSNCFVSWINHAAI